LAHYLNLLKSAYLVSGLQQWGGPLVRTRASSPKLVVWNNALINALKGYGLEQARQDPAVWGRLVENAAGAHILNNLEPGMELSYWRKNRDEVDYVLTRANRVLAIEVKSGRKFENKGLDVFRRRFPKAKTLIVGTGGIPLKAFFTSLPADWE